MKYCCNACRNQECLVNYKNAPKGVRVEYAALCGSKQCRGYRRP